MSLMCNGFTVDGLRICNTDVGQNITRESGRRPWKGLNQRSTNVWFPFVEGFPFVATISAGWDGYHVSVNGKHITAFKYRQVYLNSQSVLFGFGMRIARVDATASFFFFSF